MSPSIRFAAPLLFFGLLLLGPVAAPAAPQVTVTVKPVHSLVAGVMAGVAQPRLLIEGTASPHHYALRPSDARALSRADLVVRVSAELETFLRRPLATLAGRARILTCDELPDIRLLPAREGGAWESADRTAGDHSGHDHGEANPHLWLDPRNAQAFVAAVAEALAGIDPPRAGQYAANAAALQERLGRLDASLQALLAPVATVPFVVFHDAYAYFEARYGLTPVGAITVSPERPPGARRLAAIRQRIAGSGARCVFTEPQFDPALAALVTEDTSARTAVLDPLGADLPAGPEAYFRLMEQMGHSLRNCLEAKAED